ncbi:hypothetical protein ACT3SP_10705 [Brachybacterium sp. AOP43-C2-M15]|uniref:hypothetical protein n=1 Tax=Brachybacterium sp. AOP43-C2-M15 TaxID=3457661 RepID=UPI004033D129
MTQGYGSQDGQQPQWGQGGQNPPPAAPAQPSWGQGAPSQPQWGQTSPPPAPGGYPGAVGYPGAGGPAQSPAGDGVNWSRVKLLGLILLIGTALLLVVRLGINLTTFLGAEEIVAADSDAAPGAMGIGTGLAALALFLANLLLSLVMLVLGILAAVMGRGRARVGGIVVAVAIPLAVVLYWVLSIVVGIVLAVTGAVDPATAELSASDYRISTGIDTVRTVLMVAIIGVGSFLVHSTAAKKLAA